MSEEKENQIDHKTKTIKDPLLDPYFIQIDSNNYMPTRKRVSKTGKTYNVQEKYYSNLKGALKYILEQNTLENLPTIFDLKNYLKTLKENEEKFSKVFDV